MREIEVHGRAPLALEDLEGCFKNRAGPVTKSMVLCLWDMLQCVKHSIYNFRNTFSKPQNDGSVVAKSSVSTIG